MTDNNQIEKLEREFYDALLLGEDQIKVALLIARVHRNTEIPTEETINSVLDQLVLRDDIEFYGLIHRWRHSEIKRVIKGIS